MADDRKRTTLDQSQNSSSSTKLQKKWNWNDDKVGCTKEKVVGKGIESVEIYDKCGKYERSLEDIKQQISNSRCHSLWGTDYFYYTGFKKALTTLLSEIHQENIVYLALLIHGRPKIGKTCLAKNMAYHLASAGSTTAIVNMDNSTIFKPDHVTHSLREYIVEHAGWVILDQCNVNSLNHIVFLQYLLGSGRKKPIIMFTSGHFEPPGPSWTQNPDLINFKVIDLCVDEAGVTQVKEYFCNKQIQTTDMLKVSTVMGHVIHCVIKTRFEVEPVTLPRLEENVYETSVLSSYLSCDPSIFLIFWPELCKANKEDIVKKNKPQDWKLDLSQVQILAFLLSRESDHPHNVKKRLYVNWLHIDGDGRRSDNQNVGFFEHTNYFYYFPCLEKLHGMIVKSCTFSTKDMFKKLLYFYELLDINSRVCGRAVQGNLFETLIRLQCQVFGQKVGYTHAGLIMISHRTVSFVEVDDILTPTTVTNLCEIAEQKREESRCLQVFWCDLNSNSNSQFPGYDFALIKVEKNKYLQFQLFQATVMNSPTHKPGTTCMLSVLKDIRETCDTSKFAAPGSQGKVMPYLLCPYSECRGENECINLERGSDYEVKVVNMEKFVQDS